MARAKLIAEVLPGVPEWVVREWRALKKVRENEQWKINTDSCKDRSAGLSAVAPRGGDKAIESMAVCSLCRPGATPDSPVSRCPLYIWEQ